MYPIIVCVEVLRPSLPIRVMSSMVSLPNHFFLGRLSHLNESAIFASFKDDFDLVFKRFFQQYLRQAITTGSVQ